MDTFENFALAKFDEMLALEETLSDFTQDQQDELDNLSNWYDSWLDYAQACDELRRFYERKGVAFPQN